MNRYGAEPPARPNAQCGSGIQERAGMGYNAQNQMGKLDRPGKERAR